MGQEYDVVVVGGGSAGCALAGRLAAADAGRVLPLEAGPVGWTPEILDVASLAATVSGPSANWAHAVELRTGSTAQILDKNAGGHPGVGLVPGNAVDGVRVNPALRMQGLEQLRVVDLSVLPVAPRRGPAATAVAVGEAGAEFLGADFPDAGPADAAG